MDGQVLKFGVDFGLALVGSYLIPAYGIRWIARAIWKLKL